MPALIMTLLRWFAGFAIAKFFVSLAIGLVSFSIVQYFFDKYINGALQQVGHMGNALQLMSIAQLDHAISIVIGALTIRAFMSATKLAVGSR